MLLLAPLVSVLLASAPPPAAEPAPPPPRAPAPKPECHTSGQSRACGFHCKAGLGEVACARTPDGLCVALEGKLVCWDPPDAVRFHPPKRATPASCRAKFSELACGYACETSATHLGCAKTPYGTCSARYDAVTCWDPSDALIHALGPELPRPQCVTAGDRVACGYQCQSSRSEVACAQTPGGTCSREGDRITCFDPPLPQSDHDAHAQR